MLRLVISVIEKSWIVIKRVERKTYLLLLAIYLGAFGYLYLLFNKIGLSFILAFLSLFFLPYINKELKLKRKNRIVLEFQDFIYIFISNLKAGKSIDNSLAAARFSLEKIFFQDSLLSKELERIMYLNNIGIPYEKSFYALEEKLATGFFKDFGQIIAIARDKGGGYLGVLVETSNVLSGKLEVEREIETLLAKQNMEVKILRVIPLILLMALRFLYPEMIAFLSGSFLGVVAFLAVSLLMVAAIYVSNKLMEVVW